MPLAPDLAQLLALVTSGNDPRLDLALLKLGLQLILARELNDFQTDLAPEDSPFGLLTAQDLDAIRHAEGERREAPPRNARTDPGPSDDELLEKLQSRGLKAYLEGT